MISTDILIIGAGPVGLFTVFEAGLLKLKCHLVDSLGQVGGQLTEIYPKKPIYDIPGYPSILAGDLTDRLMEQIAPFKPGFTLGERAEKLEKLDDNTFKIITNKGTELFAPVVAIAGGLGSFEPRKPPIENIEIFEDKGVDYIIKDPEKYRNKRVLVAGGGDSALDWSIILADIAKQVTLIHRRTSFRGALDSVEKVLELARNGKINLITEAQAIGLNGNKVLEKILIEQDGKENYYFDSDYFIPLFGLAPKLGPIGDWGLEIENNAIVVNTLDYSSNIPGIYAIGDINTYPGKLKLILCGFHEGTLMVQSAFKYIYPDQKLSFKYTTVAGVTGF
ncbi:MAG: NAD(P)/FAD-dependent oxidoreductase [Saprospiraceae bacterium]|nr:NAD(P)/FAD-dependent oxidoreductase [Saprospiraceae bacterium]MBK6782752.1 NAD(P)/FAD-dependent oxidoreductase [Saprospiraceae bacterium]MBK7523199.1 NAD(P)/FAD-dependent oxidoreductase [Saprospiraceae bacterium]MBK8371806.1 NAD(P)/FAD-dependent oxidoreductase [Saprospiraceae bacterium]MBK8853338.1 NAD(P)/FAD-dependent oxidoreductase [Saprospiraceae bacterium]